MTLAESMEAAGKRMADAFVEGFKMQLRAANLHTVNVPVNVVKTPKRKLKRAYKMSNEKWSKACSVPDCKRKHAAKGLCGNHYGKAIRLKMNASKLRAADLRILALDGRATRFAATSKLVRAAAKNPGGAKRTKKTAAAITPEQPKQAVAKVELPTPMF